MVRIGAIVLAVEDSTRAAAFWGAALAYTQDANPEFLIPGPDGGPRIHLDRDDRTHLDLWVDNETEQRSEVERLIALGARRVEWDYPDDPDYVVLADPEGNLFCIVNTGA